MVLGWTGVTRFDCGPACTKPEITGIECAANAQGIRIPIIGACPVSTTRVGSCHEVIQDVSANHFLFCNGERVLVAPKAFDVLAYLVEHAGRVVTQDEILEALWPDTRPRLAASQRQLSITEGPTKPGTSAIVTLWKRDRRASIPASVEREVP